MNRANNTGKQAKSGQSCTSIANAARCAITASQSIVPLYAVSKCLAKTAETQGVKDAAQKLAGSNLEKIAKAMTSNSTKNALNGISGITKTLAKFGIAGNITYAVAKCMDAKEEEKTKVMMQAAGNCGGMYLFEHIYSKAVDKVDSDAISAPAKKLSKAIPKKLFALKSVKPISCIMGVGFVAASLFGCWAGEKAGEYLYVKTTPAFPAIPDASSLNSVNPNSSVNTIA